MAVDEKLKMIIQREDRHAHVARSAPALGQVVGVGGRPSVQSVLTSATSGRPDGIPLFVRDVLHGGASTYALMVGYEAAGSLAGMALLLAIQRSRLSVHVLLYGLYVGTLLWLCIPLVPNGALLKWMPTQTLFILSACFIG